MKPHRLSWVVEPLAEEASHLEKAMFGCRGHYLHGRLMLVLAARGEEPWNGLLVPTEREHHAALRCDHPALAVHPLLKKWLYVPEASEDFEETARALVERALANDTRLGVEPPRRSAMTRTRAPARSRPR